MVKIGVSPSQGISEHPWDKIHRLLCYQICNKDGKHLMGRDNNFRGTDLGVRGFEGCISESIGNLTFNFLKAGIHVAMELLGALKGLFRGVIPKKTRVGWLKSGEKNAMYTSCGAQCI